MNGLMNKYDPWGPISAELFATNDSDLVQSIIESSGIYYKWPALDPKTTGFSNLTRIRSFRPYIQEAFSQLPDDVKGRVAQSVAKKLWETGKCNRDQLRESLESIGWLISGDGVLTTQDVILSEQFFPAGTFFDAYVAIRSIVEKASGRILIVDPYLGSTIFTTLRACSNMPPKIELLTTETAIKPDFLVEAKAFQKQFIAVQLEVRTTSQFHDRFVVIDGLEFYHVGASIKDAGKRAFLISLLQDQPVIELLGKYIESEWSKGTLKL